MSWITKEGLIVQSARSLEILVIKLFQKSHDKKKWRKWKLSNYGSYLMHETFDKHKHEHEHFCV